MLVFRRLLQGGKRVAKELRRDETRSRDKKVFWAIERNEGEGFRSSARPRVGLESLQEKKATVRIHQKGARSTLSF